MKFAIHQELLTNAYNTSNETVNWFLVRSVNNRIR